MTFCKTMPNKTLWFIVSCSFSLTACSVLLQTFICTLVCGIHNTTIMTSCVTVMLNKCMSSMCISYSSLKTQNSHKSSLYCYCKPFVDHYTIKTLKKQILNEEKLKCYPPFLFFLTLHKTWRRLIKHEEQSFIMFSVL